MQIGGAYFPIRRYAFFIFHNMERYLRIMNEGGTTEQFVPDLE